AVTPRGEIVLADGQGRRTPAAATHPDDEVVAAGTIDKGAARPEPVRPPRVDYRPPPPAANHVIDDIRCATYRCGGYHAVAASPVTCPPTLGRSTRAFPGGRLPASGRGAHVDPPVEARSNSPGPRPTYRQPHPVPS